MATSRPTPDQLLHLAAIVESSDDAIFSKTLDGTILSWNPGAERLYGYTAEEAIGSPVSMLAPADRQDEIVEILERLRRGETVERVETERVAKDGRKVYVSLTISPIPGPNGDVVGASTIARDITERRRTERQLAGLATISDIALRASSLEELLPTILETTATLVNADHARVELIGEADDEAGHGTALRLPLLSRGRQLGALLVGTEEPRTFAADELALLTVAAERISLAIEQARLLDREREIAATLQRSLLPERFPRLPGLALSASYIPSTQGARVGGDWYDAFPLGDGRVVVGIGDVVGHGIEAAASMGQVRNALRAYALEEPSPAAVFGRLSKLLLELSDRDFCTAFCAVLDPWAATLVYANAGHPAPLAIDQAGYARFLDEARSIPLGVARSHPYDEHTEPLEPGTLLFLYTDGLVERREESLDDGLARLAREAAAAADVPLRRYPDTLASRLLADRERVDDVAMLAVQLAASEDIHVRVPAEPASLAVVRRAVEAFLVRAGATPEEVFDLKVACGEACANVVEHAYRTRSGLIRITGTHADGGVTMSVRDTGSWRPERPDPGDRGRGVPLMRALVDEVEITQHEPSGTEVVLRRRLGGP